MIAAARGRPPGAALRSRPPAEGDPSELGLGACKERHVDHEVVAEHAMLRMLMMVAVTNEMTMMMTMMMTVTMTMFYIKKYVFPLAVECSVLCVKPFLLIKSSD